jgi:hypothetical protein
MCFGKILLFLVSFFSGFPSDLLQRIFADPDFSDGFRHALPLLKFLPLRVFLPPLVLGLCLLDLNGTPRDNYALINTERVRGEAL